MSGFTITGGVSFSGAVSMSDAPPPPENTAAWFGGGYTFNGAAWVSQSTVQRITFATDTAASTVRGPLSSATKQLAAAGNTTDAWFGGGNPGPKSTVNRVTYATDTATASVRGPLSSARYGLGAAGNTTDGWFGGGNPGARSTVDRITYATDTATASVRGPLSATRYRLAAAGNETDGWFGGGYGAWYDPNTSTVDRITYSTDTATASVRGPLSMGSYWITAAGNETDGWFVGGIGAGSRVQRVTYATDTATASVRGPLSMGRYGLAGAGNTTNGWFGGGLPAAAPGAYTSTVNRITYATDTATAVERGPLSSQAIYLAAAGGIQ